MGGQLIRWHEIWPAILVALFASGLSGAISSYVTIAVTREDIGWIRDNLKTHAAEIEQLQNELINLRNQESASTRLDPPICLEPPSITRCEPGCSPMNPWTSAIARAGVAWDRVSRTIKGGRK